MIQIVLDDVNKQYKTDYQQKDVYFEFEREVITNASDNAAIKKTEADTKAVEINLLMGLAQVLDQETVVQMICEQLDIDYNDIKDKIAANKPTDPYAAMEVLNNKQTAETGSTVTT